MSDTSFGGWLAALLQHLHYPVSAASSPVATFHFDGKPDVHVTGSQGQVDMMSEAGQLSAPYSSETLLDLLELNRCSAANDAVNVTLDRASGAVIVWARQRQAAMNAAGGARLLQTVLQKIEAIQRLLGKPRQVAPGRDAATLTRLLLLQKANNA